MLSGIDTISRGEEGCPAMYTATKDLMLPATVTGSWPRPRWYDQGLWGRPLDTAMVDVRFREQFLDAHAALIADQERAGLDILTNGDYHLDEDFAGRSWHHYPLQRWKGLEHEDRRLARKNEQDGCDHARLQLRMALRPEHRKESEQWSERALLGLCLICLVRHRRLGRKADAFRQTIATNRLEPRNFSAVVDSSLMKIEGGADGTYIFRHCNPRLRRRLDRLHPRDDRPDPL